MALVVKLQQLCLGLELLFVETADDKEEVRQGKWEDLKVSTSVAWAASYIGRMEHGWKSAMQYEVLRIK